MADKIDVVEKTGIERDKDPTEEEIQDMINDDIEEQGNLLADTAMRMSSYDADIATLSLASGILDLALACDLDIHELLDFIDRNFHEKILEKQLEDEAEKLINKDVTGN